MFTWCSSQRLKCLSTIHERTYPTGTDDLQVYLGLKTGWTFSANLFGAIFGFAIVKFFSRVFAENFPILGGSFGPKENSIIQTSATAAGGLGNLFVSAIPALYQLNLLGESPRADFPKLLTFTAVSAYYGLFFATPCMSYT